MRLILAVQEWRMLMPAWLSMAVYLAVAQNRAFVG
tara:strand:+ start:1130 stop:1234 length:105 start_codon:yes stop_codon:yes gene_type:complete